MRTLAALLTCTLLAARLAPAQEKPAAEIGTSVFGVTVLNQFGSGYPSSTFIGIPGLSGPEAQPLVYATIFASPSLTIEPQVGFSHSKARDGSTLTFVELGAQLGYLFTPAQKGSPYLAASLAYQNVRTSFSAFSSFPSTFTGPGLGVEMGYRIKVGTRFAIRFTGRYRRWFSDFSGLNELGAALGLGAVIH